jgi:hypothetical protein
MSCMALEGPLSALDDLRHRDAAEMMCGAEPGASAIRKELGGSRARR